MLQVGYNQDDMTDQSTKILTTNDPEFYEYNLPIIDKQKIIKNFIDFKDFKIIKSIKHSPDKHFTLLIIDDQQYVLDATDYFEEDYDGEEASKLFSLKKLIWITPKSNQTKYLNGLTVLYNKTKDYVVFSLAKVEN